MIIDIKKNHIPKDPQGALALRCPDLVISGPNLNLRGRDDPLGPSNLSIVVENDQPVGTGIFNMGCGDAGMPV